MEEYIQIAYLNDFIFCPKSIYYHKLYGKTSTRLYHRTEQIKGKAAHEAIDKKRYSTRKNIMQGTDVFCEEYGICGKIDLFDVDTGILTERKNKITTIYDGYIFQVYGQFYCLEEMGYKVKKIFLYSRSTNKKFEVLLPWQNIEIKEKFIELIDKINNFDITEYTQPNVEKCRNCVYSNLCDQDIC